MVSPLSGGKDKELFVWEAWEGSKVSVGKRLQSCEEAGKRSNVSFVVFLFLNCDHFLILCLITLLPFTKPFADPEEPQSLVFVRQPSSLTKVTGQNVVFPCVAGGFPTPYVRWTKNGEELITEE